MSDLEKDPANPRWLYQEYVDKGRTAPEMADDLDVSTSTVTKWLHFHEIDTGGRGYEPDDTRYRQRSWLKYAYHNRGLTVMEIADDCGVAKSTISSWLDRHDIPTRSEGMNEVADNPMQDETIVSRHPISGAKGEDHPMWAGGNWRENGEWLDARDTVLRRDEYRCQFCDLGSDGHSAVHGEGLHVHHVTPVSHGGEKYEPSNLLTLCKTCHTRIHRRIK